MVVYLLKSAAILTVLFAFYKIVLEKTSMHTFKRFYLLGSFCAAFFIPLITFTSYVAISPSVTIYNDQILQPIHAETKITINYWPFVLWTIYGLGVLFFSVKFIRNLLALVQRIQQNPKYKNSNFIHVLLSETVVPHTFFNYIFLNKTQFTNGEIPAEVMQHEETHARQNHSLDILLVEILQIVFWFNPLFAFLKSSIKLNHEFLADQAVLNSGAQISEYQKILLAFSSNALAPPLAHSINYSSIKKRFTVMKIHTSKRAIWLRSLLILPILSLLIYGFSTKEVLAKVSEKNTIITTDTIEDIRIVIDKDSQLTLNGFSVDFEDLKSEINKRNTHLTAEQKQKYISATVGFYKNDDKVLAKNIIEILYANNLRKLSMSNIKNLEAANLDTNVIVNSYSGKTIEEARILYQEYLKDLEKFKATRTNVKNDENNPWSIQVGEPEERDENTGKIIQQKATKAELAEYNKLALKYNAVEIEKRIIKKKDLERLEIIYRKMTDAQKAIAQPFPECIPPPPPSPPKPPKVKKGDKSEIPPPPPPKQFSSKEEDNKKFREATYYFKGERITFEKANHLLDNNNNLGIYIGKPGGEVGIVHLYEEPFDKTKIEVKEQSKAPSAENGNLYTAAQAPPPPNSNPVEYVKELGKRGATFYIGPHKYSTDEAIDLVRKSNEATIDVSNYPKVILGGC
ncbi:M56 family metallopeptidase [Aequorivita flava]|uniref:M56 family metallopeptidase n=1 Tax=Aequorivita flava TaxID=3114371 RepID=A0AB35YR07_9FLAO